MKAVLFESVFKCLVHRAYAFLVLHSRDCAVPQFSSANSSCFALRLPTWAPLAGYLSRSARARLPFLAACSTVMMCYVRKSFMLAPAGSNAMATTSWTSYKRLRIGRCSRARKLRWNRYTAVAGCSFARAHAIYGCMCGELPVLPIFQERERWTGLYHKL